MTPARILLVSRDADFTAIYGVALRHVGYEVVVADDFPGALRTAAAQRLDAAVVELPASASDHCALTERLRHAARAAALPVIALTAWVLPGASAEPRRCACTRVLAMPTPVRAVLDEIERALPESEARPS